MDGCYDWWKEIMQKGFSSGGFICHGKREGEKSRCATHEQENWDLFTAGGCTRNLILISLRGGEVSLFKILRGTTAPSCTLYSTWSSPQWWPWPCSCLLSTLRSGTIWKQLLDNDLLWSRRDNFSPIKQNISLHNLILFFSDLFFLPSVL